MGKIQEWYDSWLLEQAKQAVADKRFKPKPPKYIFPREIVDALREQARDCEECERDPITGISLWPKETTLEWQAADLIDERFAEIRYYEKLREDMIELWVQMRELLGGDYDETLA